MKILLMVLGGIFLVIVFLLAVLYFTLRAKWRRFKSSLKDLAMGMGGGVPSFRITVVSDDDVEWTKRDLLEGFTKAAADCGFELAGDFEIEEMWQVKLRGFINPETNLAIAYYEHGDVGVFADVVAKLRGGRWQTVSNAPDQGMDRPDFAPMERLAVELGEDAAAALAEMLRAMDEKTDGTEREVLPIDGFDAFFMDAYAREMDWRIERGGVTAQEVRAAAASGGQDEPTDEDVEMVQSQWKSAIEDFFEEQFRAAVLKNDLVSAAEWDEHSEDLLFVYDDLSRDRFAEAVAMRLVDYDDENEDENEEEDPHEVKTAEIAAQLPEAGSLREAAKTLFASLPADKSHVHKGIVTYGTREADVYLQPSEQE
jgi:hypothetical protein